jgi:hypothetical protein
MAAEVKADSNEPPVTSANLRDRLSRVERQETARP